MMTGGGGAAQWLPLAEELLVACQSEDLWW